MSVALAFDGPTLFAHASIKAKVVRKDDVTDEEEQLIQAGIANDPDNPELTDRQIVALRPASEVLPPNLYADLSQAAGRAKATAKKVPVELHLDRRAVDAFKATGEGWQTGMSDALARAAARLGRSAMRSDHVVTKVPSTDHRAKRR